MYIAYNVTIFQVSNKFFIKNKIRIYPSFEVILCTTMHSQMDVLGKNN